MTPIPAGWALESKILSGVAAVNNAPSGAAAGVQMNDIKSSNTATFSLASSTVTGAGSCSIRMWGYTTNGGWCPMGVGVEGTKGTIDAGTSIGETGTNTINHAEILSGLTAFERIYAEVTAITNCTISAYVKAMV